MKTNRRTLLLISALAFAVLVGACDAVLPDALKAKATPRTVALNIKATATRTLTRTPTATRTETWTPASTHTSTASPSSTPTTDAELPTSTATPTASFTTSPPVTPTPTGAIFTPHPDAIACAYHNTNVFHTLWDSYNDCHYDHEHGDYPFQAIAAMFPDFDYFALLCGVEISHCNPSSPMENTHKHGGNKWNVQIHHPQTCAGYESAPTGVDGSVIQFHGFGDYAIEAEVRIHSSVAFLRQCKASSPTDYGYVFVNQLQDYGQRIVPYQGTVVGYPNQPGPAFPSPRGPYLSMDCLDLTAPHVAQCRESFAQAVSGGASSVWSSKVTGEGHSDAPALFRLLWRVRDTYRLFDWNDQLYPFSFFWICGASVYDPLDCEFNNTTTQVHEVAGTIPVPWDNLAGWDTNPTIGRITAQGFVDVAGDPNPDCTAPDINCSPIKLVNAFTGHYGSVLVCTDGKCPNVVPIMPKRDIYFCGGVQCSETDAGAVPSGWIGQGN